MGSQFSSQVTTSFYSSLYIRLLLLMQRTHCADLNWSLQKTSQVFLISPLVQNLYCADAWLQRFGNNSRMQRTSTDSHSNKLSSQVPNGPSQVLVFMLVLMTLTMHSHHYSIRWLNNIMDIKRTTNIKVTWTTLSWTAPNSPPMRTLWSTVLESE